MIDETAIVRSTSDDDVVFQIVQTGACQSCEIREQCFRNDGVISVPRRQLVGDQQTVLRTRQTVNLRIRNSSVLKLTGVVYGLPLMAFFIGMLLGHYVLFPEATEAMRALGSFGTAVIGLIAAGFGIRRFDRRVSQSLRYEIGPKDTSFPMDRNAPQTAVSDVAKWG